MRRELLGVAFQVAQDEGQLPCSLKGVADILSASVLVRGQVGILPENTPVLRLVKSQIFVHAAGLLGILFLLYSRVILHIVGASLFGCGVRGSFCSNISTVGGSFHRLLGGVLGFFHQSAKLCAGIGLYCKQHSYCHERACHCFLLHSFFF